MDLRGTDKDGCLNTKLELHIFMYMWVKVFACVIYNNICTMNLILSTFASELRLVCIPRMF